jgi:hypothetical protein
MVAAGSPAQGTIAVVRSHWRVMWTTGTATLLVATVRAGRMALPPMWAIDRLGLDAAEMSVIFGLSGLAEVLLAYPGGMAMDRFGRAPASVFSMTLIGAAFIVLPFLPHTTASLIIVGLAHRHRERAEFRRCVDARRGCRTARCAGAVPQRVPSLAGIGNDGRARVDRDHRWPALSRFGSGFYRWCRVTRRGCDRPVDAKES